MYGKDLLVPNNELNISAEQVEEARLSIINDTSNASMVSLLRENVDKRKKALAVVIDENKMNSSARLANALAELDGVLLDDEVIQAVKDGIVNSKDPAKSYNEFAKASNEIYTRMMKQQLSTANPEAPANALGGRSIKIAVSDASGATMVSIGGEG